MTAKELKEFLQPGILSSINNLEFIARLIVEGFITGLHKSPFHGFSVEFSQHRPYMQGDSLKHIDWKVFARSDRYYIKQYEEETNLRCYILLDISKSMLFKSKLLTKLQYGSVLAASLSYLMLKQRDATGLLLFDNKIRQNLTARSVPVYIRDIVKALSEVNSGEDTHITTALHTIADKIKNRALIILISDLFDDTDEIISGLKHLRYNNHEIIVFNIFDDLELDFNLKGEYVFEDLENQNRIKTDPRYIREEYVKQLNDDITRIKNQCHENYIDYVLMKTSDPLEKALTEYLLKRYKLF